MLKNPQLKDSDIKGTLSILTTSAIATGWLMGSLRIFRDAYPAICLQIIAHDAAHASTTDKTDIILKPIQDEEEFLPHWHAFYEMGLWASPEYLKEKGTPQTLEDLETHTLLGYGTSSFKNYGNIDWHLKNLSCEFTVNSTHALCMAAEAGIGICSTSAQTNAFYGSKLVRILSDIQGPTVRISCCTQLNASSETNQLTSLLVPHLRRFLELCETPVLSHTPRSQDVA